MKIFKRAGARISLRFSKYYGKRKLMEAFKKLKSRLISKSRIDVSKKSIVVHFLMHKIRSYFT